LREHIGDISGLSPLANSLLNLPSSDRIYSILELVGVLIAHLLNAETATILLTRGIERPVFLLDNIPPPAARPYSGRVRWLGEKIVLRDTYEKGNSDEGTHI
jgi:hypothetical protein